MTLRLIHRQEDQQSAKYVARYTYQKRSFFGAPLATTRYIPIPPSFLTITYIGINTRVNTRVKNTSFLDKQTDA